MLFIHLFISEPSPSSDWLSRSRCGDEQVVRPIDDVEDEEHARKEDSRHDVDHLCLAAETDRATTAAGRRRRVVGRFVGRFVVVDGGRRRRLCRRPDAVDDGPNAGGGVAAVPVRLGRARVVVASDVARGRLEQRSLQVAGVAVRRCVVAARRRRPVVASARRLVRLHADVVGQARRNARHRNHFLSRARTNRTEYSTN